MKRFDVIAVGGATQDIFFTVDDYVMIDNRHDILRKKLMAFEYGAKIGVPEIEYAYGGGAANVAVGFARLGLKAAIIAAVGSDPRGDLIRENFKAQGVNADAVQRTNQSGSGVSFILVSKKHDHILFTHRGANRQLKLGPKQTSLLNASEWGYLTSLSGEWKKILPPFFKAAKRVAWNPGREQLAAGFPALKEYLKKTEVLIVNKDEAIELVMSHPSVGHDNAQTLDSMKYLLHVLHGFGPAIVIVTNGSQGASAYDGKSVYVQKALRAKKASDTTGVGDAFGATFVAGLKMYKGDIKRALALAAKNAAAVVSVQGAQAGLLKMKK